jgi:hypothetical protein
VIGLLGDVAPPQEAFAGLPRFTKERVDALAELVGRWTGSPRLAA